MKKTAVDILREIEWAGFHTDYEDSWAVMTRACPYCLNAMVDGHKAWCELKRIIEEEG